MKRTEPCNHRPGLLASGLLGLALASATTGCTPSDAGSVSIGANEQGQQAKPKGPDQQAAAPPPPAPESSRGEGRQAGRGQAN